MDDRTRRVEALREQAEAAYEKTWRNSLEDYSGNKRDQSLGLHETRLSAWEDNKAALDAMAAVDPDYMPREVERARAEAARQIEIERDQVARARAKLFDPPFDTY